MTRAAWGRAGLRRRRRHPGGRPPPPPPPPSGGTEGPSPPDGVPPEDPLVIEDGDVFIDDGDEEETTQGGTYIPPQSKSRDEWGTRPPAAATSSRQVVATYVSLSKESSDSAPSAPSTVNTNDYYNDKSGGESGCGKTSLRPDAAAAVPLVVPGRFGRGFGRAPDVTPTAGGLQHDCRTFGCFRQAGGPAAATAVGVLHCCLVCFETEGRRHSRACDGTEGPSGTQRPWAPAAPRDDAGRRTDVPLHMDESDDPSGMDEIDSLKQTKRQQQQQPQQQQQRAMAMTTPISLRRAVRRQRRCVGVRRAAAWSWRSRQRRRRARATDSSPCYSACAAQCDLALLRRRLQPPVQCDGALRRRHASACLLRALSWWRTPHRGV